MKKCKIRKFVNKILWFFIIPQIITTDMKPKIPSRRGKSMEFKVSINELTSAESILKFSILIIITLYLSLLIIYNKFIHLTSLFTYSIIIKWDTIKNKLK